MQVFRNVSDAHLPPAAITIGNFDGLHAGHEAMLAELKSAASMHGLKTCVLTFEPHPREFFAPDSAPARLTSLREKLELLAARKIDYVVVQRFDRKFSSLSALDFRDQILAKDLNARHVIVGDDFCFGAKRAGDFALLQASPDFSTCSLATIADGGLRISSTAVRNALAAGDMNLAAHYLNRPYSISGRVVDGDKIGRTLGFPTANIQIKHNRPPLFGIFVVEIHGLEKPYQGVASLGFRPTIHGGDLYPKLEAHLFDFNRQIYRQHLRVDFLHKLRDEEKYIDLPTLVAQIEKDCIAAKEWFAVNRNASRHEDVRNK
ncbi:bifunctional riboflavin kinase/FAD synthetase [Iodobacter fluviatilis]|uniref:Riboflavin biosynthesis protein n=1 Tax=Iodobacter fluviatilis TaxID=537 RepID=A0A377Q7R8_9NEIS|nr:bifunctional riboflavin kinase/FAD synthetase [Iodobacter fluviatilis]TCU89593.1 FMN adenylyltransferase /riboflavin kinase [Iodobacter fluviatilis]STQ90963.1 Riboflavin biosynthesis protein ribF [Iodobacter fluviatilis]